MYIEGSTAAAVLFLLGFLSCGLLALAIWNVAIALAARAALKLLEECWMDRESRKTE